MINKIDLFEQYVQNLEDESWLEKNENFIIDYLNKIYYTYFNTVSQENFNLHRNILSLQKICQQKMIKDFYIVGWSDLDLNCSGIDQTKIYPQTCIQILGFQNYNNYYFEDIRDQYLLPCRHPNQKGHQLIAEHLYHWIKDQLV